jgi:hypothetical protein
MTQIQDKSQRPLLRSRWAPALLALLAPALMGSDPLTQHLQAQSSPNAQKEDSPFYEQSPAQKILGQAKNYAYVDCKVYTGKTGKDAVLRGVTVLVSNGRIEQVGEKLEIPPSYERVEGGVLLPGFVHAAARAGIKGSSGGGGGERVVIIRGRRFTFPSRGSSRSSKPAFTPDKKIAASLDKRSSDWADMLQAGITTVGVRPDGMGFPGQSAVVRPGGDPDSDDMVMKDEGYIWIGAGMGSPAKKMLAESFDKAKKLIEARKKAKEEAKKKPAPKPAAKPAAKPEQKKPEPKPSPKPQPKPEPKPEPKPQPKPGQKPQAKPAAKPTAQKPAPKKEDPRVALLVEVLEGKRKAVLGVRNASELLHAQDALKDASFEHSIFSQFSRGDANTIDRVLLRPKGQRDKQSAADKKAADKKGAAKKPAQSKAKKKPAAPKRATLLLPPELAYKPFTAIFSDVVGQLRRAGHPVLLFPGKDRIEAPFWLRLAELVRAGHKPVDLVAAMSSAPAKYLGVEKRVGTIEAGKDANLIHFDRDPFGPAARRLSVLFEGRPVQLVSPKEETQ